MEGWRRERKMNLDVNIFYELLGESTNLKGGERKGTPFKRWEVTLNTNEKSQGNFTYSHAACPRINLKEEKEVYE
jgi:hypothetical protein